MRRASIAPRPHISKTGWRKACSTATCFLFLLLFGCSGGPSYRTTMALAERGAVENTAFSWNVHKGMLGVRFGMTKREVLGILGAPSQKISRKAWQYHQLGCEIIFDDNGRVSAFDAGSYSFDCLTRAFKGITERGIKMGSMGKEILRAYGSPSVKQTLAPEMELLLYAKQNEQLAFTLRNGKVVYLSAIVVTIAP